MALFVICSPNSVMVSAPRRSWVFRCPLVQVKRYCEKRSSLPTLRTSISKPPEVLDDVSAFTQPRSELGGRRSDHDERDSSHLLALLNCANGERRVPYVTNEARPN